MPNIFFDIETVPIFSSKEEYFEIKKDIESGIITKESTDREIKDKFWKKELGALNPIEGKIIMITYQVNNGKPWQLMEWKSSEKQILQELYDMFSLLKGSKEDPLNIIGFNITNFDLPFVYARCKELEIRTGWNGHDPLWLHKKIHAPTIQDILQIHLPLNDWTRYGLNHNAVAMAYDLPVKNERGDVNADYYYGEQYDKILEYTKNEFVYPELYRKMKESLVSKERLLECVRFFEEKYSMEKQISNISLDEGSMIDVNDNDQ